MNKESIDYYLSAEPKGRALGIVVGGGSEVLEAHPNTYKVCLATRKGFVKAAIRNGWVVKWRSEVRNIWSLSLDSVFDDAFQSDLHTPISAPILCQCTTSEKITFIGNSITVQAHLSANFRFVLNGLQYRPYEEKGGSWRGGESGTLSAKFGPNLLALWNSRNFAKLTFGSLVKSNAFKQVAPHVWYQTYTKILLPCMEQNCCWP